MDNEPGPSNSKKPRASESPNRKSPAMDDKSVFHKEEDEIFASNFKKEDLDNLRVFYDKDPMIMVDFYEMVKKKRKRWKFPEVAKLFVKMTIDQLRFNLNVGDILKMKDDPEDIRGALPFIYERDMLFELDHAIKEFQKFQFKEIQENEDVNSNDLVLQLFLDWSTSVSRFLLHCKGLAQRLNFPPLFESSESIFVQTFQKFSEVFFLLPTPYRKTYGIIKNVPVSSNPDVSYQETTIGNRGLVSPTVVTVCEVERHITITTQNNKGTWIEGRLSSENMGRIGVELLSKCDVSSFKPDVLGIACMGTEIIFLLLEITKEHIVDLQNDNPSLERRSAAIHYTKSYDIMKAEDRDEFIEMMFYLGCLQKQDLQRYYLGEYRMSAEA